MIESNLINLNPLIKPTMQQSTQQKDQYWMWMWMWMCWRWRFMMMIMMM